VLFLANFHRRYKSTEKHWAVNILLPQNRHTAYQPNHPFFKKIISHFLAV
jgi:hypothetical protein